jgi:hypothetical protein
LTPEEIVAELERYEKLISDLLSRFKDDKIADTDAEFMSRWIAEITDFLSYVFGQNWYVYNILTWYNYRNQSPTGNASRKIVQEILAQIRAALTRLTRNPETLAPRGGPLVAPALTTDDRLPDTALADIRAALADIKDKLPTITASNAVIAEINADILQIEVETERPNPRCSVVKTFLESLRDNLAKAAGAGVAGSLFLLGGLLAKYFGVL